MKISGKLLGKLFMLALFLCLVSFTYKAEAATIIYSGTSGDLDWSIDSDGVLNISGTGDYAFDDCTGNYPQWDFYTKYVTSAVVNVKGITSTKRMFWFLTRMTSVDLKGLDTDNVTDMSEMFKHCSALTSVDVSGFDTSNVKYMYMMFDNCSALTSVDVSGFDTSNVTNMESMFLYCSSLTSLDVSGFDTSNVTDMQTMFSHCSSLPSLDVSGFDTGNVTRLRSMFSYCSALTSLDVSGFDTGNVTDMGYMFSNCNSLTSVDVSGFETDNVTKMSSMFAYCWSLLSVDVSEFDTSNVTDMSYMFYGCHSLPSVDVSGFETGNVKNMSYMFAYCSSLPSVDVSGFDTRNVTDMQCMFQGCNNLSTSINLTIGSNTYYDSCFTDAATAEQAKIYIGYSGACTEELAKAVIATKSDSSHVYLAENNSLVYCTVTLGTTSYTYDGTAKKPSVTVKNGTTTLTEGTDYTVSYINNTNAGIVTVTITGKGNYTGTVIKTFTIKNAGAGLAFESSSISKKTTDSRFTNALSKKTDGSVTYSSSNTSVATVSASGLVTIKDAGTATITASTAATTNYNAGSASYTLTVTKDKNPEITVVLINNKITAFNKVKTCSAKSQSFSLGAKCLGGAKLSYSSGNKKVKVNSSGKVTVAANFIGSATITITSAATKTYKKTTKKITVTVKLATPSITKVSSPKSGTIVVNWKKISGVTKYQLQFSKKKNFDPDYYYTSKINDVSNKYKMTSMSGFPKGTWYVRLRTNKKVGSKNYYSGWNSLKKVKVK